MSVAKLFLFIMLSAYWLSSYEQPEYLKKFYVENRLYKKLKVKTVTDSFFINYPTVRTIVYDTLGRELDDYYASCKECSNPFVYTSVGDTTYRVKYYNDSVKKRVWSYEQFIYNSEGLVLKYTLRHSPYSSEKYGYTRIVNFYYANKTLTAQAEYGTYDYSAPLSERMNIKEVDLPFIDIIYYQYEITAKFNYIIAKHSLGSVDTRITDTVVYDKQGRLLRISSFTKRGFIGEFSYNDLNQVTKHSYTKGSEVIESYSTYCEFQGLKDACLKRGKMEDFKDQILLNEKELPIAKYSLYQLRSPELFSKYVYTYYE